MFHVLQHVVHGNQALVDHGKVSLFVEEKTDRDGQGALDGNQEVVDVLQVLYQIPCGPPGRKRILEAAKELLVSPRGAPVVAEAIDAQSENPQVGLTQILFPPGELGKLPGAGRTPARPEIYQDRPAPAGFENLGSRLGFVPFYAGRINVLSRGVHIDTGKVQRKCYLLLGCVLSEHDITANQFKTAENNQSPRWNYLKTGHC